MTGHGSDEIAAENVDGGSSAAGQNTGQDQGLGQGQGQGQGQDPGVGAGAGITADGEPAKPPGRVKRRSGPIGTRSRRAPPKKPPRAAPRAADDDDVSFHEEDLDDLEESEESEEDDSDEYIDSADERKRVARRRDRSFIVKDDMDGSGDESIKETDLELDDDDDDDDDEEVNVGRGRGRGGRGRGRRRTRMDEEEDEDEHELLEEEEQPRKLRTRTRSMRASGASGASGSGSGSESDGVGGRRRRGRARTRTRRSTAEALSLADEIRELQEDSPIREKRSLRERTKPVNYAIPPPLSETQAAGLAAGNTYPGETGYLAAAGALNGVPNVQPMANGNGNGISNGNGNGLGLGAAGAAGGFYPTASFQSPRGKRGLHAGTSFGPIRRLFPTGGPFGGNDVTAIFGKNVQFYNNNEQTNKFLDSDSSDDEILPLGAAEDPEKKKLKEQRKLNKKKKPEIADLDPLGVDMNINFDDVGGLDNYIDQLKEMVALPLLYPELYQNFNITPPRGVLFHGPPGTGKTLMARALAASCSNEKRKITFFMRKGADILSKWVGEAERQLRLLFEEAKKQQPAIIFFDEIDGLAPVRSSKQEQIHASIVSTMLALMDGMDNRGQIIIIGATNRPDAVDPALRRPGRFDREFYFPLPDLHAREKILQIHTKKWDPPVSPQFIKKLAGLTKGYGGADLRALCTEASLISIQRKFPQIYKSDAKLKVDPKKVVVKARDFMLALQKIVPSSARASGSSPQPLPKAVEPLMGDQFAKVRDQLAKILPKQNERLQSGSSIIQYYLENEDVDEDGNGSGPDDDGSGFDRHEFLERIKKSRVWKPKLLITGPAGNGLQYITSATLNFLEGYNIQMLDIPTMVSDSTRTMEATLVQTFAEAKKRQPSVICIPNLELWLQAVPQSCLVTLTTLFRSLQSTDNVVLLAIADGLSRSEINEAPLSMFAFGSNVIEIHRPSSSQRHEYFQSVADLVKMKPTQYIESRKRKKPLKQLPVADEPLPHEVDETGRVLTEEERLKLELKKFQHQDMKLKNTLKIKLSGLMDLFKNRYKRFRKPPIDDAYLVHLFEPESFAANQGWQPAYVKDGDMILEVATGRKFYNMDLDIIEERLWNGFYSEPKQFLKDIELIYLDATTSADRERVIKASEMFANAQVGIEDISQPEFVAECKATRQRELLRQELFLKEEKERIEREQQEVTEVIPEDSAAQVELTTASGNQVQSQAQLNANEKLPPAEEPASIQPYEVPQQSATEEKANGDLSTLNDKENDEAMTDSTPPTQPDAQKEQKLDGKPASASESKPEPESEPESESESEPEPEPEFIYDIARINDLVSALEKRTKKFTVEKLEEVYSVITNIIWDDRLSWDKTKTIEKLEQFVETLQTSK
ncbi:TAT-binding homolog 7 [Kluyveromyces marxianus DMKU3-1042]|uniref:TAT-binding homolog 7 n=1 Tax=Kluyveromyces marxianus (strain DMKU3-1042 / BCC 29191 / NBRC 104275) TaxID=1003335 RepID=W0T4Y0_KLUMD|nr:uncharacterized protein KLMA_10491 [Kluyveromyces marxianus DMKU3-1042]BAO38113.1 TAT-binding homolog 7 [Kluyveromyces marxianus DMKU3-1042]